MAKAVKRKLTGSTDGKSILVTQTGDPGTLLHTAVAGTTAGTYDEVWIWAYNGHTADVELSLQEGSGDGLPMKQTIPYKSGWILVKPGLIVQNGTEMRAFAAVANVIKLRGFVNAITD